MPDPSIARRIARVLVLGAGGFIGAGVVAGLQRRGMQVVRGVRTPSPDDPDSMRIDMQRLLAPEDWRPLLDGVDCVVNAAGILRETRQQPFDAIHRQAVLAAAQACVQAGVTRFIQISALGDARDGAFIASKHRADAELLRVPLPVLVLRPSVVYSPAGSYGGTSLLRALAALPGGVWLPGHGQWPLQPVALDDLAEVVACAVTGMQTGVYDVAGPQPITLQQYQGAWRAWLGLPGRRPIRVPMALIALQTALTERFGIGPMGRTMWAMLRRGNVADPEAAGRLQRDFGVQPRSVEHVLAAHPAHVQDRWHARLYFLAPLLRAAMVVLWLVSGWIGLTATPDTIRGMVDAPISDAMLVPLARLAGGIDLLLGLWLASPWRPAAAATLMLLSVLAYTLWFGIAAPSQWLDPLGGLAKNLPLLPALAMLRVLLERR